MDTPVWVGVSAALWPLYALFFGTAGHQPGMRISFARLARGTGADASYLGVASGVTADPARPVLRGARQAAFGAALRALLFLGAKGVAVLRDGAELRIPVEQLAAGEQFVVRPGEKIAADGASCPAARRWTRRCSPASRSLPRSAPATA